MSQATTETLTLYAVVGHWNDADEIEVEYVIPDVDFDWLDPREDTGFWQGGLFADLASGATAEEAIAKVRAEYEEVDDTPPEPQPNRDYRLVVELDAHLTDPTWNERELLENAAIYLQSIIQDAESKRRTREALCLPADPAERSAYWLETGELEAWTKGGYLADLSDWNVRLNNAVLNEVSDDPGSIAYTIAVQTAATLVSAGEGDVLVTLPKKDASIPGAQDQDGVVAIAAVDLLSHMIEQYKREN
jgi:hypothetical protein